MTTVFISYSRLESSFVDELEERLESIGIDAWVDRRDLPVSLPWKDDIRYAIASSALFVVCDSVNWRQSENCAVESSSADDLGLEKIRITPEDGVDDAARRIKEKLDADDGTGQLRAELTRRKIDWERSGHSSRSLVGGSLLREASNASRGFRGFSPSVRDFLLKSRRRTRRRRLTAGLGALTILAAVIAVSSSLQVSATSRDQVQRANIGFFEQANFDEAKPRNEAYEAMAYAVLDAPFEAPDAFMPRRRIAEALALNVPVSGRKLRGAAPSGCGDRCEAIGSQGSQARVSGEANRSIEVTSPSGGLERRLNVAGPVSAIAFSPDERTIAVGQPWGVAMIDRGLGLTGRGLSGSGSAVVKIGWSPDGRRVSGITEASRELVWQWKVGATVFDDPGFWFMALSNENKNGEVVGADRQGRLVTVSPSGGGRHRVLQTGIEPLLDADFTADLSRAVLVSDPVVAVVDMRSGEVIRRRELDCSPTAVSLDEDDGLIWISCGVGGVVAAEFESLSPVGGFSTDLDSGFSGVVAADDGSEVIAVGSLGGLYSPGEDGKMDSIDAEKSECPSAAYGLAMSRDGSLVGAVGDAVTKAGCSVLAFREDDGWRFNTWIFPRSVSEQTRASAFSSDNSMVAVGLMDGTIYSYALPTMNLVAISSEAAGPIRGIEFSRDRSEVMVATRQGTIQKIPACDNCGELRSQVDELLGRMRVGRRLGLTTVSIPPPGAGTVQIKSSEEEE